ncbi:tumor necrosis factor receptor superfamily member 18 [Carassius carassius]|uniref:tumor necrosis factor receptor superfamily member 18 n=1 Tax=Carassius carassius TaxID=217509 RepID=UPI0028696325|nr:tumor necrosis factor receptor superfamily member 18 [Carassius carassius]
MSPGDRFPVKTLSANSTISQRRLKQCSIYHCDTMDTAKLWFMLLCICGSWILSLAYINCDWTTEVEYNKICCKACPPGYFPKPCSENKNDSVCEKCSKASSDMEKCLCKDNHLCYNDNCDQCEPREKCKPGYQLQRNGNFHYTYVCKPCKENTYNDVEDSTCKSITKCVDGEIFAGNQTHNARCGSPGLYFFLLTCLTHTAMGLICLLTMDFHSHPIFVIKNKAYTKFTTVHPGKEGTHNNGNQTHSFMVACLAVTVFTCLVFIMYTAFKIFRYKMRTKISKPPCTHRMVLPSDTCSCKLSKEEEGEKKDLTYHSEVPCKHDVHRFP